MGIEKNMNQLHYPQFEAQNSNVELQSTQEEHNVYPQAPEDTDFDTQASYPRFPENGEFENQTSNQRSDFQQNQGFKMEEDFNTITLENSGLNDLKSLSHASRNGFVAKVYGILTYQLAITSLFIILA